MLGKDHEEAVPSSTHATSDHKSSHGQPVSGDGPYQGGILGKKSPGVQRIEAISAHFTFTDRIFVFIGVFLIAYAYGLDGITRYTYQVGFRGPSGPGSIYFLTHIVLGHCHGYLQNPFSPCNGQCSPCCHRSGRSADSSAYS
jgi:hypothetical protein